MNDILGIGTKNPDKSGFEMPSVQQTETVLDIMVQTKNIEMTKFVPQVAGKPFISFSVYVLYFFYLRHRDIVVDDQKIDNKKAQ